MLNLAQEISKFIELLGLDVSEKQLALCEQYLLLLKKWNKAFNLTAIRDLPTMLELHLVDSLAIAEFIEGDSFIDVGTGPGLPGIPLAILMPEKSFHLLDSNGKKTRFLQQAKSELALENIHVINKRVEQYQPEQPFDAVLSRAFAKCEDMLRGSEHLCKPQGKFYAMKGQVDEIELQGIKKPYKVQAIHWPGSQVERHLVIIQHKGE